MISMIVMLIMLRLKTFKEVFTTGEVCCRRGKQKQDFAILVAKHDVRKSSILKDEAGIDTESMKKVGFPYKEHRPQFGWLAGWPGGGWPGGVWPGGGWPCGGWLGGGWPGGGLQAGSWLGGGCSFCSSRTVSKRFP